MTAHNSADALGTALGRLSTERIQRLVDRLEGEPNTLVTLGAWRPRCPMMLAGYDPRSGAPDAPEIHFAHAWDHFAVPEPRRWWQVSGYPVGRVARRSDVQLLLRSANEVLANRAAQVGRYKTSTAASSASSDAVMDDQLGREARRQFRDEIGEHSQPPSGQKPSKHTA